MPEAMAERRQGVPWTTWGKEERREIVRTGFLIHSYLGTTDWYMLLYKLKTVEGNTWVN